MRWIIRCIAACCLAASLSCAAFGAAEENCTVCHRVALDGRHSRVACSSCHPGESLQVGNPARSSNRAVGCRACHPGHERIFDHAMGTRTGEQQFVQRSYARMDSGFWEKNCTGCHLQGCLDCHGAGHAITRPTVAGCQRCHNGYFTGWDYSGRAPREANMRYQRGIAVNGQTFLKMLPDVHYSAGMSCGACHSMASLAAGRKSARGCRDCHRPSMRPVEHRITAHLERLECYACHAAWAPQEYGSFFLRFRDRRLKEDFDLLPGRSDEYLASAYLKSQDEAPLGINGRGLVSPIRPQYLAYYSDIMTARNGGPENVLLAAEWRAWFPHTIQRGTVGCEGCHDTPRRFLLEPEQQRIYLPKRDGLGLESFWNQAGQRVVNGSFFPAGRYQVMNRATVQSQRATVEKWKTFLKRVEASSHP